MCSHLLSFVRYYSAFRFAYRMKSMLQRIESCSLQFRLGHEKFFACQRSKYISSEHSFIFVIAYCPAISNLLSLLCVASCNYNETCLHFLRAGQKKL
jgi:hypothetical protein